MTKEKQPTIIEKVESVYRLNDELQGLLQMESEEFQKVLDQKEKELTIKSNENKPMQVTVGEMVEEHRASQGTSKRADEVLRHEFPVLFEYADERAKKNQELDTYIRQHFGFSFQQMTIADYMKMTEALIKYKAAKKKK